MEQPMVGSLRRLDACFGNLLQELLGLCLFSSSQKPLHHRVEGRSIGQTPLQGLRNVTVCSLQIATLHTSINDAVKRRRACSAPRHWQALKQSSGASEVTSPPECTDLACLRCKALGIVASAGSSAAWRLSCGLSAQRYGIGSGRLGEGAQCGCVGRVGALKDLDHKVDVLCQCCGLQDRLGEGLCQWAFSRFHQLSQGRNIS
mmetsp:Transcript_42545/g.118466  ORF Transcript_42545/g.118466 Transcript_42545/m.118466 type:complete len:203 (-) Transcript_42545:298-906(-)